MPTGGSGGLQPGNPTAGEQGGGRGGCRDRARCAVVPHHIPGFSGSSKIIQPGVSGARTTAETHLLSTSGGGTPFWALPKTGAKDMDDMADGLGMRTIFNVVMDSQGGSWGSFYGDMRSGFQGRCRTGHRYTEWPTTKPRTSWWPIHTPASWISGSPTNPSTLAQRMVKPGGTIIVCTPAPEGSQPGAHRPAGFYAWSSRRNQGGLPPKEDQKRGGQRPWPPPGPWCGSKRQ
jgi:hypothetical protein